MPSNKPQKDTNEQTPTLSLKDQAAAEEAQIARQKQASDDEQATLDPLVADPENPGLVSLTDIANHGYDALHEAFRRQNAIQPKEYVPPAMTERQLANLREEQEAGRAAVARAKAQQDARPVNRDSDGVNTPVFRPGDHVPGINSRDPAVR